MFADELLTYGARASLALINFDRFLWEYYNLNTQSINV